MGSCALSGPRESEAKRLRDHKNILIGLVGRLRNARPGEVTDNHFRAWQQDPRQIFVVGLRKAIVEARNHLAQDQYVDYFTWLNSQLMGAGFSEFPTSFKALDGLFDTRSLPADAELEFTARRLLPQIERFGVFETARHGVATAILHGDAEAVQELLALIEMVFGNSLWLSETGLASRQFFEGLEAQKRYSEEARTPLRRSIYAYLVRQASVRNEPSTTWPRFRDDLSRRIAGFGFDDAKTAYIRYRLFGEPFQGVEEALSVLAAAQSYPLIDLYMTVKDLAAWAASAPQAGIVRDATEKWLSPIESAIRVRTAITSEAPNDEACRVAEAIDSLAAGQLREAYRLARRGLTSGVASAPLLAVLAVCSAESARPVRGLHGLSKILVNELRSIALGSEGSQVATSTARKLTQNFRGLAIFYDLRQLVEFLAQPTLDGAPHALASLFEQLPEDGVAARSPFDSVGRAVRAIALGDLDAATTHLAAASGEGSKVADRLANILLIHIAVAQGATTDAARRLAREAARTPQAVASLPTEAVIPSPRWGDFKEHAAELFPSIVMDLRWKLARDDRTASIRRFAFNEVLRLQGVTRPTELEGHIDRFERAELVYFLRNVCVSNVMDMSSFFPTLTDVEDEVIAIQSWLVRLDPANRHEYDARRVELTNNRAIHEGLRIVDSSRIHVDVEAITAWARKEVAEYFARYVELVGAGVGVADDLATLLKQLTAPDADLALEQPGSEADAILIDQTRRLQDQFLHNPEHGLDSYLSRRVRHHPLTATLRSPVEFNNLITTRVTEFGDYRENMHWLERLGPLSDECRYATSAAFQDFAVEFDQILTDLKDERFHVRTPEKPHGLFDADIGPLHHHLLRAIVQLDMSMETYITEALGIFSTRLELSLEKARKYLDGPVKQQVADCFDKLRARLHSAEASPAYSELAGVCGDAAAEVQRKLSEVSEWLSREEGLALSKTFSLRQVLEIGMHSALDPHKEYQPIIDLQVEADNMEMPATNVALISEFLLVILNNARLHGGIPYGQKVTIVCAVDVEARTLTLRVDSNVHPHARNAVKDRKVRELIQAVKSGKYDRSRVRREGNSGFVKIASVVSQQQGGSLDFGFIDDQTFFVEVVYSLIILERAEA